MSHNGTRRNTGNQSVLDMDVGATNCRSCHPYNDVTVFLKLGLRNIFQL